jgi:hypothetical protein
VEKGLGFWLDSIGRLGGSRARAGLVQRKKMTVGQGGQREERIWHVGPVRQRGRGEGSYRFGYKPGGLWAGSGNRQNGFPLAFSFFFCFLYLFLFSDFYFFHILCNNASNQLKPLSKIF